MNFTEAALRYCKIRNGFGAVLLIVLGLVFLTMGARVRKTKPFAKTMMGVGALLIALGGISYYFRDSPFFCGMTIVSNATSFLSDR